MFIDTSGFLCLLDISDSRHEDAQVFYDAATKRLTHNYVLGGNPYQNLMKCRPTFYRFFASTLETHPK